MKINIRKTHDFIEISVDEIETTVMNSSKGEINSLIENLRRWNKRIKIY